VGWRGVIPSTRIIYTEPRRQEFRKYVFKSRVEHVLLDPLLACYRLIDYFTPHMGCTFDSQLRLSVPLRFILAPVLPHNRISECGVLASLAAWMRSPDYGESPLHIVLAGLDSVDKHVSKCDRQAIRVSMDSNFGDYELVVMDCYLSWLLKTAICFGY
jgi:hypothetical protein